MAAGGGNLNLSLGLYPARAGGSQRPQYRNWHWHWQRLPRSRELRRHGELAGHMITGMMDWLRPVAGRPQAWHWQGTEPG